MRGLLLRQAVAVVLVGVLGAVSVWWTLRLDWFSYRDNQLAEPAAVTEGRLGSAGYTVTETRIVAGDSERGEKLEVAPDATLVIVTLDVTPADDVEPESCTTRLVGALDDNETRWDTASYSDTAYSPPDRFSSFCSGEAGTPYSLQAVYVVPAAAQDFELEVTLGLQREALRLVLDPPPAG